MNFSVATFVLRTGILLLFLSAPLQAQVAGAALSGTVTGPSGAAVANARVTVKNAATGQSTETQTDSFGSYHVQNLMSGDYDVSVSEEGFSPKAVKVTITAGAGQTVNLALTASPSGNVFHGRLLCHPAPKAPGTPTRGPIRVHKALAWVHGTGTILTPIPGAIAYSQLSNGERIHGIAKAHSYVAWVTTGAYGAAILSVSVKF